jgi:hypothetical protein
VVHSHTWDNHESGKYRDHLARHDGCHRLTLSKGISGWKAEQEQNSLCFLEGLAGVRS